MSPDDFAKILVRLAQADPVYDCPEAVDETVYLLAWHIWDLADQEAPE